MISNPKDGWCRFELGSFVGSPSYLTDVPDDLLDAFIHYHQTSCGGAWFDEEGTEFTFVVTPYAMYVIEERDETPVLHDMSELDIDYVENELIADIERDLEAWAVNFTTDGEPEEIERHKRELEAKLATLKAYRES